MQQYNLYLRKMRFIRSRCWFRFAAGDLPVIERHAPCSKSKRLFSLQLRSKRTALFHLCSCFFGAQSLSVLGFAYAILQFGMLRLILYQIPLGLNNWTNIDSTINILKSARQKVEGGCIGSWLLFIYFFKISHCKKWTFTSWKQDFPNKTFPIVQIQKKILKQK